MNINNNNNIFSILSKIEDTEIMSILSKSKGLDKINESKLHLDLSINEIIISDEEEMEQNKRNKRGNQKIRDNILIKREELELLSNEENEKKYNINKMTNFFLRKEQNKDNHKRLLCKSTIIKRECEYGMKCLYAHNLSEQNIEQTRKKVIDMIRLSKDFSKINITIDKDIYNNLLILTKICEKCINKICTGGYNCKFGSCDPNLVICYDDMNYNNCIDLNCKRIHLSERGLKPYYDYKNKTNEVKYKFVNGSILNNTFLANLTNINDNIINEDINYINNNNIKKEIDEECKLSIFDINSI